MTTREAIEARLKDVQELRLHVWVTPEGHDYLGETLADLRTLLDALATVEAERDEARLHDRVHYHTAGQLAEQNVELQKRVVAAEARAEALARAVRDLQVASADVTQRETHYREIQDNEDRKAEKRAFDWPALSKAQKRRDAAIAALLALDVQESS